MLFCLLQAGAASAMSLPPPVGKLDRLPWKVPQTEATPATTEEALVIEEPKGEEVVLLPEPDDNQITFLLDQNADQETRHKTAVHFVQALVSAYQTNPQLKAERENLKAVDESVAEAWSAFRPDVNADYQKGRRRNRTVGEWTYFDSETRELRAEQALFTGGEGAGALKAARSNVKAARAQLLQTEQQVLLQAATAYLNLAESGAVRILSRHNVDVLRKHLEITGLRFDAGELTRTDVTQAESRLARAEADLQLAIGDMEAARATFERIIGFKPGVVNIPEVNLPLPPTLPEAQSLAVAYYPPFIEAQQIERAADHAIESQTGELLPDVSVVGIMNRSEGSAFPGVNNYDNDTLALNVSIPLYQGGAEYARLRAAKNRYQQSRFLSADVKNATIENATRTWHDWRAALSVIVSSKAAVEASQTALEGVEQEYEFGERTTLDVLDAEQELFINRVSLIRAQRNKIVTAFALLAATGQLSAEALALPVELYDADAHYDKVKWLPIGF